MCCGLRPGEDEREKRSHRVPWVKAVSLCKLVVVGCGGDECRGVAFGFMNVVSDIVTEREREMIKKINSF